MQIRVIAIPTAVAPLPGPIFIHAAPCSRYDEQGGFPVELLAHPLTLAGYGAGRGLREEVHVGDGPVEAVLAQLLARQDVDYIHVRDTAAGCYDFRIERG